MIYIATFYSHFAAVRFKKRCEKNKFSCRMMPVPRNLSSSCGTCVRYEGALLLPEQDCVEEIEQIVAVTADGYQEVYRAENS